MTEIAVSRKANEQRIIEIEKCFGNFGQPLFKIGRILIGEGILTKICRKKYKQRQFFLFNNILVYGNIVINNLKFTKQRIIALETLTVKNLDGHTFSEIDKRLAFQILSPTKSFILLASNPNEKLEWLKHIEICIYNLKSEKNSLVNGTAMPLMEASPIWIPDDEAHTCMHCRKSQFTVLNRKHHCRKCGIICCSNCSSQKFLLANISTKPVRVCRTCYNKLTIQSLQHATQGETYEYQKNGSDDSDSEFNYSMMPSQFYRAT